MADLAAHTNPAPFLSRTVELGDYYGIRRDGQLIAMAGERLHLDGWTEISAVCTAPAYRGQGIATAPGSPRRSQASVRACIPAHRHVEHDRDQTL